jgi:hypothetical protein
VSAEAWYSGSLPVAKSAAWQSGSLNEQRVGARYNIQLTQKNGRKVTLGNTQSDGGGATAQ